MDLKQQAENLGLEEDDYIEMLNLFVESGCADLEKLEAGIMEEDVEKAYEASHSFKGSSGSLGLEKLFQLAKAIDEKDWQGNLEEMDEMVKELRQEYELLARVVGRHSDESSL